MLLLLSGCRDKNINKKIDQVLGIQYGIYELDNDFSEFAGFGEGYTLEIYKLSEGTIKSFIYNSNKKLPLIIIDSEKYLEFGWFQAPFDTSFNEIRDLSLGYYSGNKKLESHLAQIEHSLTDENNFYSFYCLPNTINPRKVEFYVLDVEKRKLFVINSQL